MEQNAYTKMYKYEQTHWWFVARRAIIKSVIENNIDITSPIRILEIGSGTGGNHGLLSSFGQLTCIEPNKIAAQLSEKRYGHKVINQCLENISIDQFKEPFDLIVLLDVVEHIAAPQETLEVINDLLSDKGKVLITTPAYQFLWGPHDIEHHHHRRYNKKNLILLLRSCGLSTQKISYFNSLLFPLVLFSRLVNKIFKRHVLKDSKMPPDVLNSGLKKIFSLEKYIINRFNIPFGCSILAICEQNKR